MATMTLAVSASLDDGQTYDTGIEQTGTLIMAGYDDRGGGSKHVHIWTRFLATGLPTKATINQAYLIMYNFSINAGTVNVIFYGENVDSAAQISSYSDFNGRSLTSASVAWNNVSGSGTVNSPELKTIIQEIVNRAGFNGSSNLQLFIKNNASTGDRRLMFASWDNTTYTEPQLFVDYTPAGRVNEFASPIVGLMELWDNMKRRTKLYQDLRAKGAIPLGMPI